MKARFIICIDDATLEDQNKVTEYFKNNGVVGYWHWYSDMWLIIDTTGNYDVDVLRKEIDSLLPEAHKIVFKIESGHEWSAYGEKDSFKWLHETWSD